MKRPLKIAVPAIVVGLVVLAGSLWWQRREQDRVAARERASLCLGLFPLLKDLDESGRQRPTPEAPPGWDVVAVKVELGSSLAWRYVNDYLNAPDGQRIEAVVQPDGALDLALETRREREGSLGHRSRHVILPDRAWLEDAATDRRVECDRPVKDPLGHPMSPVNGYISRPFEGWGIDEAPVEQFPDPARQGVAVARRIGERAQNGETLPLYEMLPSQELPHLRGVFALDEEGYLRYHEVTDTRSGEVVLHREADPVPDHPPIGDPTGQPVISAD